MRSPILTLLFVLLTCPAAIATTPPYDAFLLPVVVSDSPGAFGARWDTSILYAYTGTSSNAYLSNSLLLGNRYFVPGERGELSLANVPHTAGSPGFIFDTTANDSPDIHLVCYVHERSGALPGVTIPAVRFTQIGLGPTVRLIGVPLSDQARTLVRIYDLLRDVPRADVTARVFDSKGVFLRSDVIHIDTPSDATSSYAPYGEYRPPVAAAAGPISIEIEAPGFGFRLWAFATTTDNVTQAVTPVFPAP